MSNQTVKQTWWPIICAIFYLPFIVFFYVGKKCNDKKWTTIGAVFLVLVGALFSMYEQFQNEKWFKLLLATYWICGLVLARYSWNSYRKEGAWWPFFCAIFSLAFIVFFYIGKKSDNKKWQTFGIIYLVVFIALFASLALIPNELITILLTAYWVCGLVHSCISWKTYLREYQG